MPLVLEKHCVLPLVQMALQEDAPFGDLTTNALFAPDQRGQAALIAKAGGTVAGLPLVQIVYNCVHPAVSVTYHVDEGSQVHCGDTLAIVKGPTAAILTGERICLNFLQRMCGIATAAARCAAATAGTKTRIVDTRKTLPGFRYLDKYAVAVGGGTNHRYSLSDAVLIKDNHIAAAGGIQAAVAQVRASIPLTSTVEVEVTTIEQVQEALAAGADIIMLDNMDDTSMAEAIALIKGQAFVELSGNVTLARLPALAALGADFISIGALTHSVQALDLSLQFQD